MAKDFKILSFDSATNEEIERTLGSWSAEGWEVEQFSSDISLEPTRYDGLNGTWVPAYSVRVVNALMSRVKP